MVKFAHIADCHLGGWRTEELQQLNFLSFQKAVDRSIAEKVDFMIIAGDLFDSAYPPIEILKESFAEFKKIKDAGIPVYLIAGSHDFSASGKTFLDVLEKAGFCKNCEKWEFDADGRIRLLPTIHGDLALYGYPGRKSGMEIDDLKKSYIDTVHPFSIFLLHTTITDVVGGIPMESLAKEKLPLADYYALGHIHKRFEAQTSTSRFVYPGPTYPMNFQELVDLKCGSFTLVHLNGGKIKTESILLPLKDVVFLEVVLDNGLTATQKIIAEIDKLNLRDKVFLLKLKGVLRQGKAGDIRFNEIEDFIKKKGAFTHLRNTSFLTNEEVVITLGSHHPDEVESVERSVLSQYVANHPASFNKFLPGLMNALSMEKNEDEKSSIFEERLLSEFKSVLEVSEELS